MGFSGREHTSEQVATSSSWGSSRPKNQTRVHSELNSPAKSGAGEGAPHGGCGKSGPPYQEWGGLRGPGSHLRRAGIHVDPEMSPPSGLFCESGFWGPRVAGLAQVTWLRAEADLGLLCPVGRAARGPRSCTSGLRVVTWPPRKARPGRPLGGQATGPEESKEPP